MKTFLVLTTISVLLIVIVVSYVSMSEDYPSEKEFQALLKKKTEEIKIAKEALQGKAQKNLNFLRALARQSGIIAFTKTGVLLSVHPKNKICLKWSSSQQEVEIITAGWVDYDDMRVENLQLDEIQNLAELSEIIIIRTILKQL